MYRLPLPGIEERTDLPTDHVCIVGFVSNSSVPGSAAQSWPGLVNAVIGGPVFEEDVSTLVEDAEGLGRIRAYHKDGERTVYVFFESSEELGLLLHSFQTLPPDCSHEQFSDWLESRHSNHLRGLLFMFSVCHMVVMMTPSSTFDPSLTRTLRFLEAARPHVLSFASTQLGGKTLWTDGRSSAAREEDLWPGRCVPKLYFLFQIDDPNTNLKTAQQELEGLIRRLFKSARLRSTMPASAAADSKGVLFSLPSTQFAYFTCVGSPTESALDINKLVLQRYETDPAAMFADAPLTFAMPPPPTAPHGRTGAISDLRQRIQHQAQSLVADKSKLMQPSSLPTLADWLQCSSKLIRHLAAGGPGGAAAAAAVAAAGASKIQSVERVFSSSLKSLWHFSQKRCRAALPVARDNYTAGLPPHYAQHTHEAHLQRALAVFAQLACGPALNRYAEELQRDCSKTWQDGRRLCEARSITGRSCIHPLHSLPAEDARHGVKHKSTWVAKCACACGRTQQLVSDQFKLSDVNLFFVEHDCCQSSRRYRASYGLKSGSDAPTQPGQKSARGGKPPVVRQDSEEILKDKTIARLLKGIDAQTSDEQDGARLADKDKAADAQAFQEESSSHPEARNVDILGNVSLDREIFPSWRLVCLGFASVYSPTAGLSGAAGFLKGTNFLLPWDVPMHPNSSNGDAGGTGAATSSGASGSKGSPWHRKGRGNDGNVIHSARVFVGYEYECAQGHRFIASASDKTVKLSASGYVKGTANKVLRSEMPMLMSCLGGCGLMAQLKRIHVVVPDVSVSLLLKPRVQLRASPELVFSSEAIQLDRNGLYAFCLPQLYAKEGRPVLMPSNPHALRRCVILPNALSVAP